MLLRCAAMGMLQGMLDHTGWRPARSRTPWYLVACSYAAGSAFTEATSPTTRVSAVSFCPQLMTSSSRTSQNTTAKTPPSLLMPPEKTWRTVGLLQDPERQSSPAAAPARFWRKRRGGGALGNHLKFTYVLSGTSLAVRDPLFGAISLRRGKREREGRFVQRVLCYPRGPVLFCSGEKGGGGTGI